MQDSTGMNGDQGRRRLPPWFKVRLSNGETFREIRSLIRQHRLHTVCSSAACPNRTECWNAGTATFMLLGDVCTRGCGFCNVRTGLPAAPDFDEPERVAAAVALLDLSYAVITSVTRDDLADGGAGIFAATITAVRKQSPECRVEVLIPDFQGSEEALETVLSAGPDVLNHNLETVLSLYGRVRPLADYQRSLQLLKRAKSRGFITKTGIMLGLGEGTDELRSVLRDLRRIDCDLLTLGQYLQPNKKALPVMKYYRPDEFEGLRAEGLALGFRQVAAGPLVRSSYHAGRHAEGLFAGIRPSAGVEPESPAITANERGFKHLP
jgi:lipoic acid synthetase